MELKDDLGPVIKQAYPKLTDFMSSLEGGFDAGELESLLRKVLSNLGNFNTAMDMLKAGMELKDDLGPVIKQAYPKITSFMADLDGQFNWEDMLSLLRNFLINVQTFDSLLKMVKPAVELVEDVGNIARQTDVFGKVVRTLNDLEERGVFKIVGRLVGSLEGFRCSEGQLNAMCVAISEIDPVTPKYVGVMEIVNELLDPNVQETIGLAFKIMRSVGCCLRANRIRRLEEEFPDELGAHAV